jgi:hypothetical protein
MLAKYVERILNADRAAAARPPLTVESLREMGY